MAPRQPRPYLVFISSNGLLNGPWKGDAALPARAGWPCRMASCIKLGFRVSVPASPSIPMSAIVLGERLILQRLLFGFHRDLLAHFDVTGLALLFQAA